MADAIWPFANVGIRPVGDLESTAQIIGAALGLNFSKDTKGTYDEIPAFIAERDGLHYALLGIPDPEHDLSEEKDDNFGLTVEPIRSNEPGTNTDISGQIIERLRRGGRIECWPLDQKQAS